MTDATNGLSTMPIITVRKCCPQESFQHLVYISLASLFKFFRIEVLHVKVKAYKVDFLRRF